MQQTTQEEFNDAIVAATDERLRSPGMDDRIASSRGRLFAGFQVAANLPEVCPLCRGTSQIAKRRINAAYANDEENWLTSCLDCFERRQAELAEMWSDYYSAVR